MKKIIVTAIPTQKPDARKKYNKGLKLCFMCRQLATWHVDFKMKGYSLIDRLKSHLSKVDDGGNRKYYNQAFDLSRIGAYNPVPFFIINLCDLTQELRRELSSLDKQTRQFALKQVVGRGSVETRLLQRQIYE